MAHLTDCLMGLHRDYNQVLAGEEVAHHKVLQEDMHPADMGFDCIELDMDFAVLVGPEIQVVDMEVLVMSINKRYALQLGKHDNICYDGF